MKYILLHNIDKLSKEKMLEGYINNGYKVIFQNESDCLIKNINKNIIDEDIYIRIVISCLKRNSSIKNSKGKIIDLSEAFVYANSKGKYNIFDNKFDWYIRNIIIKEII